MTYADAKKLTNDAMLVTEDGEVVVGVVVRNAFDAADEGFRTTIHAGIIQHVRKVPMRVFW